jgi:hypothetical protein
MCYTYPAEPAHLRNLTIEAKRRLYIAQRAADKALKPAAPGKILEADYGRNKKQGTMIIVTGVQSNLEGKGKRVYGQD